MHIGNFGTFLQVILQNLIADECGNRRHVSKHNEPYNAVILKQHLPK